VVPTASSDASISSPLRGHTTIPVWHPAISLLDQPAGGRVVAGSNPVFPIAGSNGASGGVSSYLTPSTGSYGMVTRSRIRPKLGVAALEQSGVLARTQCDLPTARRWLNTR
jgi:hypothetical protein